MNVDICTPDGWNRIETEFHQQIAAFQRRRDGLVLSIEKGTAQRTMGCYAVTFLPENFQDDNQPIQSYGNGGYLVFDGGDLDAARDAAVEWMKANPRD